MLVYKICDSFT